MHIFHNRPLAIGCWCFVSVAVLLYFFMDSKLSLMLGILLLSGTLIAFFLYLISKRKQVLLAFLCLLLSFLAVLSSHFFFHIKLEGYRQFIGQECVIEGSVSKIRYSKSYGTAFDIHLDSINGEDYNDTVLLKCEYASAMQIGDRFRMTATGADFDNEKYDERSYLLPDGILCIFVCTTQENCEIAEQKDESVWNWFRKWNAQMAFRLENAVSGEEGRLANALLFGNRDAISDVTTLSFRRTGVSHLLALSGLHVSILIGFFEWLLRRLEVIRQWRMLAITVLSIGYLFLTGAAPSTVRAVLMLWMMNIGFILQSDYDSFTSLSLILTIFLFVTPHAVTDLGMWMSFIATASIVVFVPALNKAMKAFSKNKRYSKFIRRKVRSLVSAVFIGIVANLALLLIQALAFGEYSILSVPATILLSIPMSLTLVLSIVAVILPPIGFLCRWSAGAMLAIVDFLSSAEGIMLAVGDMLSLLLILLITLALLFVAIFKLKRVLLWCLLPFGLSIALIPISSLITVYQYDGIKVDYRIESGGDVFLFAENGQCVAVDFSDGTGIGATEIASAAKAARCTELKDLIISHYHNRGTYFIHRLAGVIRIHNLRLPLPKDDWEAAVAARLEQEAKLYGINVKYDIEDLCIQDLSFDVMDHALFPSGRHPALLMRVSTQGDDLIYVNGSLVDSTLIDDASNWLKSGEMLIVGSTGYSKHTVAKLPPFGQTIETIILAEERSERLLPNSAYSADIRRDLTQYVFYLK